MRIPSLFVSFLLLSACKSDKEKLLVGKWNAVQLVECEEIVPINTALVNLEFKPNGQYIFNSTLNIHEEGKFRLSGEYLYTQDKVKNNAPEKAVLIKSISPETIVLQMNYKGKDQWLTLMKEGITLIENNSVDINDIEQKKEEMDSFYVQNELITNNKEQLQQMDMMETSDGSDTEGGLSNPILDNKLPLILPKTKVEEKKVEKAPEKKFETKAEAYAKREALRKREEAKQKEDERRRYENYIAREKDRKREEAKRKKH